MYVPAPTQDLTQKIHIFQLIAIFETCRKLQKIIYDHIPCVESYAQKTEEFFLYHFDWIKIMKF